MISKGLTYCNWKTRERGAEKLVEVINGQELWEINAIKPQRALSRVNAKQNPTTKHLRISNGNCRKAKTMKTLGEAGGNKRILSRGGKQWASPREPGEQERSGIRYLKSPKPTKTVLSPVTLTLQKWHKYNFVSQRRATGIYFQQTCAAGERWSLAEGDQHRSEIWVYMRTWVSETTACWWEGKE